MPPFGHKATAKADAWATVVLGYIRSGMSVAEACRRAGISDSSYYGRRQKKPEFAALVDAAKLEGRATGRDRPDDVPSGARLDFGEFTQKYFGRTHHPHQLLLARTIDSLDARDIVLVLMAPESGKTATIEDYICRKLALDPNHRFRVVSEASDLSKRIVGTCTRRFTDAETYPDFIGKFGPFYEQGQEKQGKPWTSNQITIWPADGKERDRSLVANSWTSAAYGSRIDTLILDDLQSQRNLSQSEKIFSTIRGTFFNRGIAMRTIIVGTRIDNGDFYDKLIDSGLVTRTVYIPATGGMGAAPGEPTTPAMWENRLKHNGTSCCPTELRKCPKNGQMLTPKEYLDLIRFQVGERSWWASYMQQPAADSISVFGAYLNDALDHDRTVAA